MSEPVRILVVEDLLTDYDLAQREIRKLVENCALQRVETRKEFLSALETSQPDLIISDYSLPQFDGMKALKLAQENAPLTPFIIWTGSLSEDVAVDCMKAGANNYIIKGDVKRLGPAVLHALEERRLILERKETEDKLRRSEAKYRALAEHSLQGIAIFQEQKIVYVNRAMCMIMGYTAEELLAMTGDQVLALTHPDDRLVSQERMRKRLAGENVPPYNEVRIIRRDGTTGWIQTFINSIEYDEQPAILSTNIDITERKQAEERYKAIFENSAEGIFQSTPEGRYLNVNPAMARIYGYTSPQEMIESITDISRQVYVEPQGRKKFTSLFVSGDSVMNFEMKNYHKDGSIIWTSTSARAVRDPEGKILYYEGFLQDITKRKQADENLLIQENRFRSLIENGLDNISLLAEDGTLLWENPTVKRTLGYEQDEFVGRDIFELMHPDDLGWTTNTFAKLLKKPGGHEYGIFRLRHHDGTWRWIESIATNLLNEPSVHAIVINYRDVTERKRAEMELQQRNDDLGLINAINEAATHGESLDAIVNLLAKELKRIFSSEGSTIYMLNPDGRTLSMQQYFLPSEIAHRIEGLIGSTIPLIEIPIREGGYFQKALNSTHGTIATDPEEIKNWMAEFIETTFIPHAARGAIRKLIPHIYKLLNIKSTIVVPLLSNGKAIGLLDVSSPNLFTDVELTRIENIAGQLTAAIQRQQADEKIRRSEEFLRSIQNALSASIVILDETGTIVRVNSAWRKFGEQNGLNHPAYGVGLNYLDICDSATGPNAEEASDVAKAIREVIAGQRREAWVEYPCHSPRENRWFILQITKFEDGDHLWVVLAHENISERKMAEEAIEESNARFRTLFEASPEAIMLVDPQGDWPILDCNTAASSMNGYTRDEMVGQSVNLFNLTPGEPAERTDYLERIKQAGVLRYETFHRHKDGTVFPIEVSTSLITLGGREVILGIDRDITERKRAEEALRESEALYRRAIEVAGAVPYYQSYYENGRSIKYEFIGEGIRQITGYGPEEFSAQVWDSLVEEVNLVEELEGYSLDEGIQRVRSGKNSVWKCEHRIRDRDGKIHWVFEAAVELRDEQGISRGSIGTYQDITTRKQAVEALRESEQRYRVLFEDMPIAVWEEDFSEIKQYLDSLKGQGITDLPAYFAIHRDAVIECASRIRIINANNAALQMYGAESKEHLIAGTIRELSKGELEHIHEDFIAVALGGTSNSWEGTDETLKGEPIEIGLSWSVVPGYEADFSKVIVTTMDLTERKQAEREKTERLKEMTCLYAVRHEMGLDLSLEELCERIIHHLTMAMQFPEITVTMIELDGRRYASQEYREDLTHHLSADILIQGVKFGRVQVFYNEEKPFIIPEEQNLVNSIADDLRLWFESKRAEEALRQSENRYRTVVEHQTEFIVRWKLDGTRTFVNDAYCRYFGITPEQALSTDFIPLIYEEDRPAVEEKISRLLSGTTGVETDFHRVIRPDGNIGWQEWTDQAIHDENGQLLELQSVGRDITERRRAEEELKRSHSLLNATLESTTDGILVVAPDRKVSSFNRKFLELWRIPHSLAEKQDDNALLEFVLSQLKDPSAFVSKVEALYLSPEAISFDELEFLDGRVYERYSQPQRLGDDIVGRVWSFRDITERKRAENELRASNERFRQLADNIQEVFWISDVVTKSDLYLSPAYETIWGRPVEEQYQNSQTFIESILPEDRSFITATLERQAHGERTEMEYRIARPDGSVRWIWDRAFPIFDDSGKLIRLAGIAADITERKRSEDALREAEIKYRMLVERLPLVVYTSELGMAGRWSYVSPQIELMLGFTPDEWMANPQLWFNQIHPDDRARQEALEEQAHEREGAFVGEYRIFTRDGRLIWIRDSAKILSTQDGNMPIVQGVMQDITERKQAEIALRESEERFGNAFEFAPIGIALVSIDGRWLRVNQALCELVGYSAQELLETTFQEITHPDDLNVDLDYVSRMLAKEIVSYQMEKRYFHKLGHIVWVQLSVSLVLDEQGRSQYFISQIQDITERKQNEAATRRRADEFAALYETARDLATQYSLPSLLNTIVERACTLLHAPGGGVYLYDETHGDLEMVLAVGSPVPTGTRLKMGEGMAGRVAQTQQLLIVDDYHNWEGRSHQYDNIPFRAILQAPMLYGGKLIGVLLVHELDESDRRYTEADAHLLSLFAEYAASAVHAARLLQETRRRAEETTALLETSLALTSLDLETNLKTIGNRARSLFSGDGCRIFLLEPDNETLRCVLALQENPVALSNLRLKLGEGVTGAVAATGQAEIVNEMQHDPRAANIPGTPDEEEAIMFAPLKERDRVIGVLSIRRIGTQRPFQPTDLGLLEAFASMTASAVSNARLFDETQRRLAESQALYENGLALGRLLKPGEIGERIIETFEHYLSWHHVAIRLKHPENDTLELIAFNQPGLNDEERLEIEQRFTSLVSNVDQGLSGWTIQTGKPTRTGNVGSHPQYVATQPGIQSGLYTPLKIGERIIGVISVESEKTDAFTAQDERLLATLANQAAVAFENARLYQSIQQERERFLDLFENSPVATWLEDFTGVAAWMDKLRTQGVMDLREYLEGRPEVYRTAVGMIRILDVNQAAVITNGARNKEELINRVHELLVDAIPSPVMINELEMIWEGQTSFGFEMSSQRLDGSIITGIQRIYIPINNDQPDYARVIVTSTDITDRVNFEQALRASEVHYRELADSITDIFFELDQDLHFSHWNKASEALIGLPAEHAIGKSMLEVFGESEEQIRIGQIFKDVLAQHQPKTFETTIQLNNTPRAFEINAYPSTRGVSVVAKDITERKRTEAVMQKRFELMEFSSHHSLQELMQRALDEISEWTHSTIGFFQLIEEDQVTPGLQIWSTNSFREFQTTEEREMHKPADQAGVWAEAIRQRRSVIHNDFESLPGRKGLPEGHTQVIRELIVPVIRNERITAVIGIGNKPRMYTQGDLEITERFADYAWDIIERKQMEVALADERNLLAKRVEERTADLSRANSNLARALRVKDEFLANMSHELRTPLNAILGLSESLAEQTAGPLNDKQQRYLTTISESGHHLLSLINDILDLAKIEAGQITLDINKVNVNSVCQGSLRMIKQLSQKRNLEVSVDIDEHIGLMWADERRLKQMIVNLLSNAVKFTPENGRIGLDVKGDQAENKVMITVWDTGIGIRENDFQRLFQPFVQLDSGLARETTGTGLGLALVAQMARLHGGSVTATSEPGQGSRFTIILPWEPALAVDTVERMKITGKFRAIRPGDGKKPTILLIEDTREVIMMISDYLEINGYKVVTAEDGIDGINQARLTHPDLILMDIQMPRMDGLEATRKLRSEPEFKYTPIIALTALAMPRDRERCIEAGMDEYISKPVNLRALVKIIQSCLSMREEKTQLR